MQSSPAFVYARLLAAIVALAAGVGAIVFVVMLFGKLPPIASSSTSSTASSSSTAGSPAGTTTAPATPTSSFPVPPRGAVVFGGEAGLNAVGLAVVPRHAAVGLQASVVDGNADGVEGLSVRFDVRGPRTVTVAATPCGRGCYRASAPVARPRGVTVVVGSHRVDYSMPLHWPPSPATKLVEQATHVYRSLHTFVIHDSLGDGHVRLSTIYHIVAPDKLTYSIRNGGDAVIIGGERWDLPVGSSRWVSSPQAPITQPTPFWSMIEDAHLLGTVTYDGRPAWKVSFFDPDTPGWYTLVIDKSSLHTMSMLMTAAAHFMYDTYGDFNAPLQIVPPR